MLICFMIYMVESHHDRIPRPGDAGESLGVRAPKYPSVLFLSLDT
jgi:hypothetical protein